MKNIIKKLLKENLSTINDCDCCQYFDMNSLSIYGGLKNPIYYVINKTEIHELVYMNPKDYIHAIARGFRISYDDTLGNAYNDETGTKYAEMMKSGSKAPIGYYVDGKAEQEGRHRAAAAMKLGCNKIPVVKMTKYLTNTFIKNYVNDLIGLSREEVDNIFKNKGYHGISDLDWRELNNYINYRMNE